MVIFKPGSTNVIMADFSQSHGSEFVYDFFCELCFEEQKQEEAEGYCVDCGEYLCQSCYQAHRKTRATRHHVLQGKDCMPKGTPLSLNRVRKDITTKCKVHQSKPVKYYCRVCGVLGCSTCFVKGHRGCSGIETIVDVSDNIGENREFKDFLSLLQSTQENYRDLLTRARENKVVSERCCADVVSAVRQMKEEAIAKLDEAEQNIVALAEQMKTEDEKKLESLEEECEAMYGKFAEISASVDALLTSNQLCQAYISMRESQSEMKALQKNLEKLEADNVVKTFKFEPNPDLASVLRSSEVLGKVSHQRQKAAQMTRRTTDEGGSAAAGSRDANTTATSQPARVTSGNPVSAVDGSKMTASCVGDINVRSDSDTARRCSIIGSAVVSADRLLLADWNNDNVKLVDTRTQRLLSQLKLPSVPRDVTVINTNQAAVTLAASQKILLLGVADTLTSQRAITVRGKCRGVAYSQDRLVVTFVGSPRVEIIDLRGNVIRRIENSSDGSRLFGMPQYVCVSRDNVTLFVSDFSRGTVTSLTFDGVVKSIYEDKELSGPCYVCTDHHGNVYVCGYDSDNVHMMTADCRKVKVILTKADGLNSRVLSVCHCQDTSRLFVGMYNDNVKVFQLSQK